MLCCPHPYDALLTMLLAVLYAYYYLSFVGLPCEQQ